MVVWFMAQNAMPKLFTVYTHDPLLDMYNGKTSKHDLLIDFPGSHCLVLNIISIIRKIFSTLFTALCYLYASFDDTYW